MGEGNRTMSITSIKNQTIRILIKKKKNETKD
ncbi:Uncharacterised protein [Streptococcus equi subsp. equi]|nr:hypothetical protein SE071780_00304 [Streptococcus equi subsp. equi]SEO36152.1 hypothetical protein SAMN05421801_15810 [Streptococcus equi]CRR10440.1 Uncharacterised protein [Streptococcus equi subsp. equi]CRR20198.1 Uncharacterised protein [Streptococcus equi subsp. equi]CRR32951.1 Uncharacterised protein [Streptococcus equi subsp. equi]